MFDEFRADLHCHSDCSDGSDAPQALLIKAKQVHLQGLAITDHDTIEAYTPALWNQAKQLSLELLTGVEISSEIEGHSIHILGYGFDATSASLRHFLLHMQTIRFERNQAILAKLKQYKMPIEEEELSQFAKGMKKTLGRPHIADLMVRKKYVGSFREAFDRFLGNGKPCYVSGFKITPFQAIEAIHQAKGKAVLAHPHLIQQTYLLNSLFSLPFDGIECYYSLFHKAQEEPWIRWAHQKGWIATGGSDYHGAYKPNIHLGASWVDRKTFERLK